MKRIISKYISLVLLTGLLATVSCEKWIDPKVNDNPDQLVKVPLNLILPSTEVAFGYTYGGMDAVGITGIWMNQIAGVDRQGAAIDHYVQTHDDINNIWTTSYAGIMMDCKQMIIQAGTTSPHFAGVAKILLAATLGNATSFWGDIPYSEAFNGIGNLAPKYDSQQSIYSTIQNLLDEAIANLAVAPADNAFALSNDLIYNGSRTKWTKAAYVLKARYAMHLSKKNGASTTATAVLAALTNAITTSADDALIPFDGSSSQSQSPMFQMNDQRSGYLAMDPDFQALLDATGDPRRWKIASDTLENNSYMAVDASIPVTTFVEACFLKAEALLIQTTPDAAGAATAYNAGLTASLSTLGITDPTWLTANKLTAGTITLEKVMTGKYIAMVGTIEPFNDWRRTGFPVLTPNPGNLNGNQIPVRYIYPTSEINYNKNTPTGVLLNTMPWAYQ